MRPNFTHEGPMARINIDDLFWKRTTKLAIKLGDHTLAVGQALTFMREAQDAYKEGKLVTKEIMEREGLSEHLIGIFAVAIDFGFQYIDADEEFGWLLKRKASGQRGGIKSGEVRRAYDVDIPIDENYGGAQEIGTDNDFNNLERSKTKQTQANPSKTNPLPLTLTKNYNSKSELDSTSTVPLQRPRGGAKFNALSLKEVLETLGQEKFLAWLDLYDDQREFVERELKKAWQYYHLDNPSKKPKSKRGWSQALSSWLERGWSDRAKGVKGRFESKVEANDRKSMEMLAEIRNGGLK